MDSVDLNFKASFASPPDARLANRSMRQWGLLLLAMMLSACGDSDRETPSVDHPWINPPRVADEKSVQLPAWLVYRVADAVREETIAALAEESYIQLSPAMASYYTGTDVRIPAEMRPFLVRSLGTPDSPIEVIQSLEGLWMRSQVPSQVKPEEQPLVVLIDPTPNEIFVTVE